MQWLDQYGTTAQQWQHIARQSDFDIGTYIHIWPMILPPFHIYLIHMQLNITFHFWCKLLLLLLLCLSESGITITIVRSRESKYYYYYYIAMREQILLLLLHLRKKSNDYYYYYILLLLLPQPWFEPANSHEITTDSICLSDKYSYLVYCKSKNLLPDTLLAYMVRQRRTTGNVVGVNFREWNGPEMWGCNILYIFS